MNKDIRVDGTEESEFAVPQFDNTSLSTLKRIVEIKTLSECVNCAADLLGNPVLIVDSSCNPIVHSKYEYGTDRGWDDLFRRGEYTYEYMASIANYEKAYHSQLESGLPTLGQHSQSDNRRIAVRIYSDGVFLGTLLVVEVYRRFSHSDTDLAYIFAKKAEQLIVEQRSFGGQAKIYRSLHMLIVDRLDGMQGDRKNFEAISSKLEKPDSNYYLVLVDISTYSKHSPNTLRDALKQLQYNTESFFYNGNLLVLISLGRERSALSMLSLLESTLCSLDISAAISDRFDRLFDIPEYYRQVSAAIAMVRRFGGNRGKNLRMTGEYSHLIFYNDLRFLDMARTFLTASPQRPVSSLCDEKMLEILRYDRSNGTRYLSTLWVYLNNDKNTQNASKVLGIHRNTLNYHLRQMEEMFHLDYGNTWMMFRLYLSCLIYISFEEEL